jgi:enamine deaminase RidA (YjgF/YER057c/UK114 family)
LTLDGKGFIGEGDPAAQAEQAMRNMQILLEEAGAQMEDICLINNFTTNRTDREQVYPVVARHLQGVNPVSTGLIVKDLAAPYIRFEIDAWAVIPRDPQRGHQRFRVRNAKGGFAVPGMNLDCARIIRANDHLFFQGQTGMTLDGRSFVGAGDPAKQAEVAMQNVRELLADTGAGIEDVCKITTYLTDPSHRQSIYPVLARHLQDVHPAVTSIVVKGLAQPEIDFEIDVFAMIPEATGHQRFGVDAPHFPSEFGCPLSKAVRAGEFTFLQGQNGLRLDGSGLTGPGDPTAQAEQAMCNVKELLAAAGGRMEDICKITPMVTDHASRAAVYPVLSRHLSGIHPTSTDLVVNALSHPELDFEIDVFAVIPQNRNTG